MGNRIFPTEGTALASSSDIVNPLAYQTAIDNRNLLVLFFPFIFLCVAMLVHYYWGQWKPLGCVLLFIFVFDFVVAIASSKKIHEYFSLNDREYNKESWSFFFGGTGYWPHVLVVIFCGFGTSIAAGALYHAFSKKIDASTDTESVDASADAENIEE